MFRMVSLKGSHGSQGPHGLTQISSLQATVLTMPHSKNSQGVETCEIREQNNVNQTQHENLKYSDLPYFPSEYVLQPQSSTHLVFHESNWSIHSYQHRLKKTQF